MSKYFDGELLSGHEKSPKTTIFGEEHFIDTTMINLIEQRNNAIDNFVFEQMENVIKGIGFVQMPQVEIDKDKLRKWVVLCMKLENIEHSELVDMATKKRILDLEAKLAEKEKMLERQKIDQLYLELLFTRLQWIHKEADACREEKERFGGIEDMALDSVWRVLDLQKHECCGYEEMAELDDGIGYIAEDKLLTTIEHDLNFRATRTENEILDEIKQLKEKK